MKNKFLILGTVLLCTYSFAQKGWVTGTMPVIVKPHTLFYFGQGLEIKQDSAAALAKFTNQGNVQVKGGDFIVRNNIGSKLFINDWLADGLDADFNGVSDDLGYGQLMVQETFATLGTIHMKKKVPDAVNQTVSLGLPFTAINNAQQVFDYPDNSDLHITNVSNRLRHPFFQWNNNLIRFDKKNVSAALDAFRYHIVRDAGGMQAYNNGAVRYHRGTPKNTASVQPFASHASFPNLTLSTSINAYNERYKSYQDDPFRTYADLDWGKNQYQYGNPYTSNLDLSYIGWDESGTIWYDENGNGVKDSGEELNDNNNLGTNLVGVAKIDNSYPGHPVNPGYGFEPNDYGYVKATADATGKFVAGDAGVLLIKPFETFIIKTTGSGGGFNFNDGIKTFAYSPKVANANASTGVVSFRTTPAGDFGDNYYQLRMVLNNENGFVNRSYVVANSELTNGQDGMLETFNIDLEGGIYTKEEVNQGVGLDPTSLNDKLYINQINTSYTGNAIPVFIDGMGDGISYTINFDLLNGISDMPEGQLSYSNGNAKYFFHDIYTNEYFEIFNNTNYTFTKNSNDGSDQGYRFELYFGNMNSNLGIDELNSYTNATVIYQNGNDENIIRFDNSWKTANISVYSAVGQIVYTKKGVDTQNDYVLPLSKENSSVYIVRLENPETNEVVNKQIVVK